MEEIFEILKQEQIEISVIDFKDEKFNYSILNGDKIVFFIEITQLDDILVLVNKLPDFRDNLKNVIKEMSLDTKKPSDSLIEIPAFLWDLYIVAFRKATDLVKFDEAEVDKIHKDHFVARKIVIEYSDVNDLKSKIYSNILPEKNLNEILRGFKGVEVIHNSELIKNVNLKDGEKPLENFNDITEYLNKITSFIDTL